MSWRSASCCWPAKLQLFLPRPRPRHRGLVKRIAATPMHNAWQDRVGAHLAGMGSAHLRIPLLFQLAPLSTARHQIIFKSAVEQSFAAVSGLVCALMAITPSACDKPRA